MKNSNNKNKPEDDSEYLGYFEQHQQSTCLIIPIDEDFDESRYYRNVVDRIEQLEEGDLIRFKIDSCGGHLSGLIQLLTAIENTDANVIAEVIGECHSAASILALSCPNIKVYPYANMMVHFASFGSAGKGDDVKSHTDFNHAYCRKLFTKAYRGFLTDNELEQMLIGKEFWFDADEILRRLDARNKFAEKEAKALQKKAKAKLPEYDPKDVAFKRSAADSIDEDIA